MAGIYIHIPFCKQACHYCDFHFSTNTSIRQELISCMLGEILLQQNYLQEEVTSIYFGGGTPSLLTAEELDRLLSSVHRTFTLAKNCEVTLEANPDDLSLIKLNEFNAIGINRLSIGIQSFQDKILKFLNRAHTALTAKESIRLAREAGFKNISIDLIYAIPEQSDSEWISNVDQALALDPEHISAYSLTIEEKTAFGKWSVQGILKPVDDEVAARQLEQLIDKLETAGYEHYEISNFSKPGFYSRHNSSYWKQQKYLGIGPSAHSYNLISRQFNVSNNHLYIHSLKKSKIPFEIEVLSGDDHVNEYLLTTLRTVWGADIQKLKNDFHYDIMSVHSEFIRNLVEKNLAVIENNFLKLTRDGKLLADKISSDLFLVS